MSTPRSAAQAPDISPIRMIGLAVLMRNAFAGADLKPLGAQLIARVTEAPDDANALMDLSTILQLTGNREVGLATQAQALAIQSLYSVPAAHPNGALRVLVIMAPGDLMANTPIEFLVEDSDVHLDLLYIGSDVAPLAGLPEHDVVFVAVGESDANQSLLSVLANALQCWPRPVLNCPSSIARLSRDGASDVLQSAPGVLMPPSVRITRACLGAIAVGRTPLNSCFADACFPIIVRPTGSHAGQGLCKLDCTADIEAYLQEALQPEFYVSRFINYRSADGMFRKFRIILIDGRPHICHMGISEHWMIHYLNAGMTEHAGRRAEEARFMANFDNDFAARHQEAFSAVANRLCLNYVGIDCAETLEGKLLIFEVDSDMIVHAMDPVDMFAYKQPVMARLFTGFRKMLSEAAGNSL